MLVLSGKAIDTLLGYRLFDVNYEDGLFLYDVKKEGLNLNSVKEIWKNIVILEL